MWKSATTPDGRVSNPALQLLPRERHGLAHEGITIGTYVLKHAPSPAEIADAGVVALEADVLGLGRFQRRKDFRPGQQSAARHTAIVFAGMQTPELVPDRADRHRIVAHLGHKMVGIEQDAEIGMRREFE